MSAKPQKPPNLSPDARRFWRNVTDVFDLEPHEYVILAEVVHCLTRLDELQKAILEGGVMVDGAPNPALVEARQQQVLFARLLATLRLPDDWAKPERRPQRRGAARGSYGPREPREVTR